MLPSPFPRLDSIPPTLPPPPGNVAAINSLNASTDAGAGGAKMPFPGPGLSGASAELGCRSLRRGGKGCGVLGESLAQQSRGALPAADNCSPMDFTSFQGTLQHSTGLVRLSPLLASLVSGSSLFIPFFLHLLSSCPPLCDLLILSLLCAWVLGQINHCCACWRAALNSLTALACGLGGCCCAGTVPKRGSTLQHGAPPSQVPSGPKTQLSTTLPPRLLR